MKNSQPKIRTHKGMIMKKRLATDCTNFTHKSHIFKGIRESLRYVHRFETTRGCFFRVNFKNNSAKRICVN